MSETSLDRTHQAACRCADAIRTLWHLSTTALFLSYNLPRVREAVHDLLAAVDPGEAGCEAARPALLGSRTQRGSFSACGVTTSTAHEAAFKIARQVIQSVRYGVHGPTKWPDEFSADLITHDNVEQVGRELGFAFSERFPKTDPDYLKAELDIEYAAAQPGRQGEPSDLTPEVKAILLIQERLKTTGRLPTKTAVAQLLEVDRRTLNTPKWRAFKVAYAQLQAKAKQRKPPPRGSKDKDGNLEARQDA